MQALAHGVFQGTMYSVQGCNFWNGFAAGSISSIAGSLVGRIGGKVGKFLNTRVGSDLFAMTAGGAGASLTGGNFWQGAVTGLIVNELNHRLHPMGDDDNGYDLKGNKINDNGGDKIDYLYDDNGKIIESTKVFGNTTGNITYQRSYGVSLKGWLATGACTEDNILFETMAGGAVVKGICSPFKFVSSPLVLRPGGESTFKLGLLHKASGYMIRFERHSANLIGGGRAYFTHFNIQLEKNYHIILNPAKWGKFKF